MADININNGARYTFGRFAGETFIADSTDGAEGMRQFNKNVVIGVGAKGYADDAANLVDTRPLALTVGDSNSVYIAFNNSTTGYGYNHGGLIGIDASENFRLHGYATSVDVFDVYLDANLRKIN